MAEKTKDTLFIDMKYIILYRKLGYREVAPDVFRYDYFDTSIVIEAEKQSYCYRGETYPLLAYKDFVILECIDRLLKKGYPSQSVRRYDGADLSIYNEGTLAFCVHAAAWGKEYKELLQSYTYEKKGVVVLYTSQLSGGLVEFLSEIHTEQGTYTEGIFEKERKPYEFTLCNPTEEREYPKEFSVKNGELLKYQGEEKLVQVPAGIRRIGAGAFWNNLTVEEIILPEGVKTICGDAFVYCENLKHINIPATVEEIGDDPFAGCFSVEIENRSPNFILENGILFDASRRTLIHYTANLLARAYQIPQSVEWIGKHSFYHCEYLEEVTIPASVSYMGNNAFSDCRNIHLVNKSPYFCYEGGVLYNREMTTCMHYSMGSGVKEVRLVEGVRTIGRNCFWNADMIEKIVIPKTVRQIGYNPFANCKNITFENQSLFYCVKDGILYDSTMQEVVCCPSTAPIHGEVVLPSTVVNIGRSAFTGCESLKRIVVPEGVRFISRGAFSWCANLEEIVLPNTLEELGDWAFNNCISLKKIVIPKGISIAPSTFKNCPAEIIVQ